MADHLKIPFVLDMCKIWPLYNSMVYHFQVYCRSGFMREVKILANFARRTDSQIQESCEIDYHNNSTEEK